MKNEHKYQVEEIHDMRKIERVAIREESVVIKRKIREKKRKEERT